MSNTTTFLFLFFFKKRNNFSLISGCIIFVIFFKFFSLSSIAFTICILFIGNAKKYLGKIFFNLLKQRLFVLYILATSRSALKTG